MFHRILVPLDTTAFAAEAIAPALLLARASGASVDFILVHEVLLAVAEGAEVVDEAQRAEEEDYVERFMTPLIEKLRSEGMQCGVTMRAGDPGDTILDFARKWKSDLVVIASHGRTGLGRVVLGSLADELMHELDCPILMVRPDTPNVSRSRVPADHRFHRILVLLDGSTEAEAVLRDAEAVALSTDATLVLLRVVRPVAAMVGEFALPELMLGSMLDDDATSAVVLEAESYLAHVATQLRRRGPIMVETDVHLATDTRAVLPALVRADRADLVVMTSHARGASRFILGSVTDAVLRGTECAVLLRRRASGRTLVEPEYAGETLAALAVAG